MSDNPSETQQRFELLTFTTAHTGYVRGDVDRLLGDLKLAADKGEPFTPIIDGIELLQASFGYDTDEVDVFLHELRDDIVSESPLAGGTRTAADAENSTAPPEPAGTSATEMFLAELAAARFRMSPRSVAGYGVGGVDDFIDEMGSQVRAGKDVSTTIQNMRFPMAGRRMDGYDVGDVDSFLDRLEILAIGGDAGSRVAEENTSRWRNLAGAGAVALVLLVLVVFLLI